MYLTENYEPIDTMPEIDLWVRQPGEILWKLEIKADRSVAELTRKVSGQRCLATLPATDQPYNRKQLEVGLEIVEKLTLEHV